MSRAEKFATAVSLLMAEWAAVTLLVWGWSLATSVMIAAFIGSALVFRWVRTRRIERGLLHDPGAR